MRNLTVQVALLLMMVPMGGAVAGDKSLAPAIPMRESGELNSVWTEAAAQMSDDSKAWKEIQKLLLATTGSAPATKVDAFRSLYDFARGAEEKRGQLAAAQALMDLGGPEVVREFLLHPHSDFQSAACKQLLKSKPKQPDKGTVVAVQPSERDFQAVPFLAYVLQRNNFLQSGSEEATVHAILKRNLVRALLYITDTENQTAPVNVHHEKDVDRVLALARKWMAEKGLQPLEKQRPPKTEPPTDSKTAPGPTVHPGAKAVGPTDQPASSP